jgi:type IV secretory pathway ATPase VirB11/archaellum biosynthesis ATPase
MDLPYFSTIKNSFSRQVSLAERVYRTNQFQGSVAEDLAKFLSSNDKMTLAYLWLAIESDFNILIISNNSIDTKSIIDAIGTFVPIYSNVLDLRKRKAKDRRINFIDLIDYKNIKLKDKLEIAKKLMSDRILLDKESRELNRLFKVSKEGISFIAEASGNLFGKSIIKMLKNRFKVKDNDISMLDLSVFVDENDISRIKAITEYHWIDRCDTNLRANILKKYENIRIMKEGHLIGDVENSKLVKDYSYRNLLDEEEVFEELSNRAKFLDNLSSKNPKDYCNDEIIKYYSIKT